jgi:hypothetical protein
MMSDIEMILKRFDAPDQVRVMEKGRFELVSLRGQTFGRAIYEPGWKWSVHVGPERGSRWCTVEHLCYVVSGASAIAFEDGRVVELPAGTLFYVPPVPHDSWVVGDTPYTSLHLLGAEGYAV